MLHILLMIIKIAGILLAVIVGLLLLAALLIMFVPLRYRVDVNGKGTPETLNVRVKFSWFLHLIAGRVSYDGKETQWQIRLAWKKMHAETEEEETEERDFAVPKEQEAKALPESVKREETEEIPKQEEPKEKVRAKEQAKPNAGKQEKEKKKEKEKEKKKKKKKPDRKKYTKKGICDKISTFIERKEKVVEFLEQEVHRNAFTVLKTEAVRLCKFLKPAKIRGRIHYGFEDPYRTGTVLAGASMLYPFYGKNVSIEPDFENRILEGDLYIKGCIYGIHGMIVFLRILLSKDIRTTYRHIRAFRL